MKVRTRPLQILISVLVIIITVNGNERKRISWLPLINDCIIDKEVKCKQLFGLLAKRDIFVKAGNNDNEKV